MHYSTTLAVGEVRRQIDYGEAFYTEDARGNQARVEKFDCGCGVKTIRSNADATTANNLDSLPGCG